MRIFQILKNKLTNSLSNEIEGEKLLIGKLLSNNVKNIVNRSIKDVEFKVFSQFGDDGIIQWLINNLNITNDTFIEFGVEDYSESNTRFLMMNDNWSGFVMDGSSINMERLRNEYYYWKFDLNCKTAFIDKENINELIKSSDFNKEVGLLHIDLDGNDYFIWQTIDVIAPIIVIIEYNSLFGIDRPIIVPYDKHFVRSKAHYSYLFWGSSLKALYDLALTKGYSFIGSNMAGNNAYFVRKDKINNVVKEIKLEEGFNISKYRESRDKNGKLNYLSRTESYDLIKGMSVYNTETNHTEIF